MDQQTTTALTLLGVPAPYIAAIGAFFILLPHIVAFLPVPATAGFYGSLYAVLNRAGGNYRNATNATPAAPAPTAAPVAAAALAILLTGVLGACTTAQITAANTQIAAVNAQALADAVQACKLQPGITTAANTGAAVVAAVDPSAAAVVPAQALLAAIGAASCADVAAIAAANPAPVVATAAPAQ